MSHFFLFIFSSLTLMFSCDNNPVKTKYNPVKEDWDCVIGKDQTPDYSEAIGCEADFKALASEPLDASIPGATSVKTIIDLTDSVLYFQNSEKYSIHWDFATAHLSGQGRPIVQNKNDFDETQYYRSDRRFVCGTITRYNGPGVWTYEISPYDVASPDMMEMAYKAIADSSFFGPELYFHPTSQAIEKKAKTFPASVKVITTNKLYEGIDYQPLNFAKSIGRLVFIKAKELDTKYVGFRDIVVLDAVPNDISVTSGIITQAFQTPLSHINVLSQNRGTPNMALRGAYSDKGLRALEGKWVQLNVGSFEYNVSEVTKDQADAWWDKNKPADVSVPKMDLETKDLRDMEDMLDLKNHSLGEALALAIPAFGGKASHYGAFPHMDNKKVPYPKAFAIPVYYYWRFMEQNGFLDQIETMLADSLFQDNPAVRDSQLKALRDAMEVAPVDTAFEKTLITKLNKDFPGVRMRFRSSTNAEDLDGFTGAGLYTSKSGDLNDPNKPVLDAIRKVWASVWYFRAYEERAYRNINHQFVGMALLVHRSFPNEEANGVAITANPFDPSGLEPGFYINVQKDGESVVQPGTDITSDQFIYHFTFPGQPIVFLAHSSFIPKDTTVLTVSQTYKLGIALEEIHQFFRPLYGSKPGAWYAMDTEFKFDQPISDPNGSPVLFMKQARPYPGFSKN